MPRCGVLLAGAWSTRIGGTDWGTVMAWWTWGLIGWALLATVGVLWMAAMCRARRRRRASVPDEPLREDPPPPAVSIPSARRAPDEVVPPTDRTTQPLEHLRPLVGGGERTGSEVRSSALQRLLAGALAGDYTLPATVVRASAASDRLRRLELSVPQTFGRSDAAAHLLSEATAGRPLDPTALSARIDRSCREMQLFLEALEVVASAVEQGEDAAAAVTADLAQQIVEQHLRSAHRDVVRRAGHVATRLARYTDDRFEVDTRAVVGAGRRVRSAFAVLPDLVHRHRSIRDALEAVNELAGRRPRHDVRNLFAFFEDPLVFSVPGLPYGRTPEAPLPADETARLLWLVSVRASIARPWLPTVADQDTAWLSAFGPRAGGRRPSSAEPETNRAAVRLR